MSQPARYITEQIVNEIPIIEINESNLNDYEVCQVIAAEIDDALERFGFDKAIIDLKNVEYITSLGLVIFARLVLHIKQSELEVVISNASDMVVEVLKATHLDEADGEQRLVFSPSVDDAISRFVGPTHT